MGSAVSALASVVKEEIAPGIREQRIKLDPVWEDIIVSSTGVTRDGIGRDWKFIQAFESGDSGAYEFTPAATLAGANLAFDNPTVGQFGTPVGFPGRTESTNPAFFQKTVTLKEARGNLFVPLKWMQIDQFDSSVGSAVKVLIRGAARKAARAHAIAYFTSDATNFKLVTSLAASAAAVTHTIVIDNADATKASGRINMIHNGMTVDIYTTTVKQNTVAWVVTNVDWLHNTFTIKSIDATESTAIDAEDYLVLRNSRGNQPSGINTWTTDTGTVFGIPFGTHKEFTSLLVTETGPATDKMLNKHIGTFFDRLGTLLELDTLISSAGVVHKYLENEDNLATYERNGRRLEVKPGWAGIDYSYDSMPFRWAISQFVEPQTIFACKMKNNIREYVPPPVSGGGKNSEFGNEIVFVGPLGGSTSIFMHDRIQSTGSVGDQYEAPYYRQCEVAPEQMQGVKISGLDESYTN